MGKGVLEIVDQGAAGGYRQCAQRPRLSIRYFADQGVPDVEGSGEVPDERGEELVSRIGRSAFNDRAKKTRLFAQIFQRLLRRVAGLRHRCLPLPKRLYEICNLAP
jgi:hypothetical protein